MLGGPPSQPAYDRIAGEIYRLVGGAPSQARPQALMPAALVAALQSADPQQTLFVLADAAALADVPDTGWRAMEQLRIEPVNPRMWGRSVYVFTREDVNSGAALKGLVRWAGPPDPQIVPHARAALRRLGFSNVDLATMNRSAAMAAALERRAADVVAIYDEEPSAFLDGFVTALTTPVRLWLIDEQPGRQAVAAVTDGLPTLAIPYDAQHFYVWPPRVLRPAPARDRVAAVLVAPPVRPPGDVGFRFPILLTNARATGAWDRMSAALRADLRQVVARAYLRALFEAGVSRCDERDAVSPEQFKTALLNGYFDDRNNPYAVLGLLGHLLFARKGSGISPDEFVDDYTPLGVLRKVLREEYKLNALDAAGLVRWLKEKTQVQGSDVRAQFAGYAPDRVYADAVGKLKAATTETRPAERIRLLSEVRGTLVGLAEATLPSTCGRPNPDRGLWAGIDFEPFFYLAVIDAMVRDAGTAQ